MKVTKVLITTISLLFIFSFLLALFNLNIFITTLYSRIRIDAYIERELTQSEKERIMAEIRSVRDGIEITYYSKDEALEALGVSKKVVELLDKNPLPDSFRVVLKGRIRYPDFSTTASAIRKIEGVYEVVYPVLLVEKIAQIEREIKNIFFGAGVLVGISTFLLIFLADLSKVIAQKREIKIMELCGTSSWSIRLSFLTSNMLEGLMAGTISLLILWVCYHFFLSSQNFSFLLGSHLSFFSFDLILSLLGVSVLISFLSWLFIAFSI
jgi:cell division protein FtsX